MHKFKYLTVLTILFTIISLSDTVLAGQTDGSVGFSIKSVQSEKQVNKKASYFDLLLEPGEEHVLEIDIFNNSDTELDVSISACTAGTNSGGVIDYDKPGVTDPSLEIAFEDIAHVETPSVIIEPRGSYRASITIEMPDKKFDGVMLGGIVVKKIEDSAVESSGTSVQNEYCYILGAKIMVTDIEVEPDFRINYVAPKLSNHHTSIAVNLQNFKAAIAKGVTIEAAVYLNEENEPSFASTNGNFDVAPNSNFDYIIPCEGMLSPGFYTLIMNVNQGEKDWKFEESFTVSDTEANNINTQAVNVPQVNYYKIATIGLSLILILMILIIILRRKREK